MGVDPSGYCVEDACIGEIAIGVCASGGCEAAAAAAAAAARTAGIIAGALAWEIYQHLPPRSPAVVPPKAPTSVCTFPLPRGYDGPIHEMSKTTRRSAKERSTKTPSWARGAKPDPDEGCKQFAARLLDGKYGMGNWEKGAGSEFSQIVKRCQRGGR